jgi:hypothetical protein
MRETMRYAIALFLLVGVIAVLAPGLTVKAQQPGVYPGESFTYGRPDGNPWVWMDPSEAPALPQWEAFVNMSTISFNISSNWQLDAPYTQVMFNETFAYRNGTVIRWPGQTVDVGSGGGIGASWIICPGLAAGDHIYPGNSSSPMINETSDDQPFWPGREVCILNYSVYTPVKNASSEVAVERTVFMWDRDTGVLLAGFEEAASYDPTMQSTVEGECLYELIANSVGIPLQYPTPMNMMPIYVIVAISVIIILAVVIVRVITRAPKKKHKRLREKEKT